MYCLNLRKRLLPARKAWRSFTTKLQSKLHKLQKSKSIKKKTPCQRKAFKRTQYRISTAVLRPSVSSQPHLQHKKQLIQPPNTLAVQYRRSHVVQKRAAPVYVDELFNEPISKEVEPSNNSSRSRRKQGCYCKVSTEHEEDERKGKCSSDQKTRGADEMWESVGLASPLMYGIDERAEEFIARFRADLARGV
ncbi:hypothetical protein AAG906_040637 [Vitis piasezkii]